MLYKDVTKLSNVKESVTSLPGDKSIMYTILQNNLPQNEAQAEVSFDNVSQNVFNLTGRHNIASQSNSKSVQDGGRSNIGGGICHNSCVIGHFASTTKKECPCTSGGITVNQSTPICTNNFHLYMYNVQFTNGIIFQIITLPTLYTSLAPHAEINSFGWLGIHGLKR